MLEKLNKLIAANNLAELKIVMVAVKELSSSYNVLADALGVAIILGQNDIIGSLLADGADVTMTMARIIKKHHDEYSKFNSPVRHFHCESAKLYGYARLAEFDRSRQEYLVKFQDTISLILDYCVGINLEAISTDDGATKINALAFLKEIDVTGFNFVGVSAAGVPISKWLLEHNNIQGAQAALTSSYDLAQLPASSRKTTLQNRVKQLVAERGIHVCGLAALNLVELWLAAKYGDITAVRTRVLSGTNPNSGKIAPIIAAATHGHLEIVQYLASQPDIDKTIFLDAIAGAEKNNFPAVAAYLVSQKTTSASKPY